MTSRFALGTFSTGTEPRFPGLVLGSVVHSLIELAAQRPECGLPPAAAASTFALLQAWDDNLGPLNDLAESVGGTGRPGHALDTLTVHPPVDLPRQIFCTGANYRKHVVDMTIDQGIGPEGLEGDALRRWAEDMMDTRAATGEPYVFSKVPSSICGAYDPIRLPPHVERPDWELELAVIVGKGGRHIHRDDAMKHVAGYAIVNDVSARDLIPRRDYAMLGTDWLRSKSPPTFMPFGPLFVPAAMVEDPHALQMVLKLNGQVMQNESTADMLFNIPRQIEYISKHCELWPGDLIATGSPAGNGTHYHRYLTDQDVVDASIEGLGAQRNICIADPAQ
jgi:2,4-didehydro-3-deoxy-L-rhamnonate hydrolase